VCVVRMCVLVCASVRACAQAKRGRGRSRHVLQERSVRVKGMLHERKDTSLG
jgi:hypothetical protein